jgi:hypothetical protein
MLATGTGSKLLTLFARQYLMLTVGMFPWEGGDATYTDRPRRNKLSKSPHDRLYVI